MSLIDILYIALSCVVQFINMQGSEVFHSFVSVCSYRVTCAMKKCSEELQETFAADLVFPREWNGALTTGRATVVKHNKALQNILRRQRDRLMIVYLAVLP